MVTVLFSSRTVRALGDVGVRNRSRETLLALGMDNRCGQSGFTMVNVTNRADVDVRFRSLKLLFSHFILLRLCFVRCSLLSIGAHDQD